MTTCVPFAAVISMGFLWFLYVAMKEKVGIGVLFLFIFLAAFPWFI